MDVCNSHLLEKGEKIDLATCLVLSGTWNGINTSWKCKRLFSTYAKVIFMIYSQSSIMGMMAVQT